MSSTRDDRQLPELDEVGKAYRQAGFDDEPPAHVDAFILAAAKRESKRSFNEYLPSLAMAATVVLALGLVLRLTLPGNNLVEPAAVFEAEDAAAPPERLQERTAPAAEIVPVAEDGATPRQRLQGRTAPLEEIAAPAAEMPAVAEEPATATLAPAAADVAAREGVASSAVARIAAPASMSVPCAAPERGDPGLWLACIAAQIDANMLDAARAELEEFRLAFADSPIPANIADALDP